MYGLSSFGAGDRGRVGVDVGRRSSSAWSGWPRSSPASSCCSATTARCWTCARSGYRIFTAASVLMMLMMAVLLGTIVLLPIYMQNGPAAHAARDRAAPAAGRAADGPARAGGRAALRPVRRAGAAACPGRSSTSLALWSATLLDAHSPAALILVFHLLLSVGLAFAFTPLFTAGLGALPPRLYSYGSAIFGATQQLAGAAGVALLVSVYSVRSAALAVPVRVEVERIAGGVHAAFVVAACLSVAGGRRGAVRPHAAAGGCPRRALTSRFLRQSCR